MKTHVFIGTTCGPVAIQRITPEESGVQSVVCLNGTVHALPISAAYHDFVRRGTGIVARDFRHDAFRVDVAERIDQGVSWQLPMYVAHAVQANGELGNGQPDAGDHVIWATGEVGADGVVRPVERTADKLKQSLAQIQQWRKSGIHVRILLPDTNLAEGVEQVSDLAGVAGVHTLAEALQSFSGDGRDTAKVNFRERLTTSLSGPARRHWRWAVPLLAAMILVALYWFVTRDRGHEEVIILDDFGGQVSRPDTATGQLPPSTRERDAAPAIAVSPVEYPLALYAMYGNADCSALQSILIDDGQTLAQSDDGQRLCSLALATEGGPAPIAVELPEGRLMSFGPVRDGRRQLLGDFERGKEVSIAVLWPAGGQPLRSESLFARWLAGQVREGEDIGQKDIEAWVSEQEQSFAVRFIPIESD